MQDIQFFLDGRFKEATDKDDAWEYLCAQLKKDSRIFRILESAIPSVPDKSRAWRVLLSTYVSSLQSTDLYDWRVSDSLLSAVMTLFSSLPENTRAVSFEVLLNTIQAKDLEDWTGYTRSILMGILGSVFLFVIEGGQNQDSKNTYRYALSFYGRTRSRIGELVAKAVRLDASILTPSGWNDLLTRAQDKDDAWELLCLCSALSDDDKIFETLESAISVLSDKDRAFRALTSSEHSRKKIPSVLSCLKKLTPYVSLDWKIYSGLLSIVFPHHFDNLRSLRAQSDLLSKIILSTFSGTESEKAWDYLLKGIYDTLKSLNYYYYSDWRPWLKFYPDYVTSIIASAFERLASRSSAFSAFVNSLTSMNLDEWRERYFLIPVLSKLFPFLPEDARASCWKVLINAIKLTETENVKSSLTRVAGSIFVFLPKDDRNEAWKDLHALSASRSARIRRRIGEAIADAFPYITKNFKIEAWKDLHILAYDSDIDVIAGTAEALGTAFAYIPDEVLPLAWDDLTNLAKSDEFIIVAYALYSLGRASIYLATKAPDIDSFQLRIEEALDYFVSSLQKAENFNEARFCFPFYEAFYLITFKKGDFALEIEGYLDAAKYTIAGSVNRKKLLNIVKNLARALEEATSIDNLEDFKGGLDEYRKYCERAARGLKDVAESNPIAFDVIQRGLPIIDTKLKRTIKQIQKEAKNLCKNTRGTSLERFGSNINDIAAGISFESVQLLEAGINEIIDSVDRQFAPLAPSDRRSSVCKAINAARSEVDLHKKLIALKKVFPLIPGVVPILKFVEQSPRTKDTVRIAAAQLHYQLSNSFPPAILDQEATKQTIVRFLQIARDSNADIICFPELCLLSKWIDFIEQESRDLIVISGGYYEKNRNVCPVICNSTLLAPQVKINPSAFENSDVTGDGMQDEEPVVNIYETQFGKFAVLICRDFGEYLYYVRDKVDMIFVPSYNPQNERFHLIAHDFVVNNPSYIVISNSSTFGGTAIFGQIKHDYFSSLKRNGCKSEVDVTYKLCEFKQREQGIIIADFDLVHKSPERQTPISSKTEIKPVKNIKRVFL